VGGDAAFVSLELLWSCGTDRGTKQATGPSLSLAKRSLVSSLPPIAQLLGFVFNDFFTDDGTERQSLSHCPGRTMIVLTSKWRLEAAKHERRQECLSESTIWLILNLPCVRLGFRDGPGFGEKMRRG
jgi:hypothetical protein